MKKGVISAPAMLPVRDNALVLRDPLCLPARKPRSIELLPGMT